MIVISMEATILFRTVMVIVSDCRYRFVRSAECVRYAAFGSHPREARAALLADKSVM
ncbi:hypothetical protein [Bradyrhizobium sp. CCBAU 51753]|uniref:hypothetical protein n=1 Tax=Bradyrhizobium sp. CCBAU 51753 TaxID=1325100 RepID=UPI00188C3A58|nr:hypothetical protein [Bradyrhizobium sp. CCBAU 51753]